jgi:hypothetical protein
VRRWLIALALVLALPGVAHADGDPASDVLVMQDAYYPYTPPTDAKYKRALDAVLKKARDAGYPVKVALIQTERDLGAYPSLFNDPNRYANLLARELPRSRHGPKLTGQRILVVMPGGFGGRDLGDNVDGPLSKTPIDAGAESNGLAVAAIGAVARLATANGHPVPVPPEATGKVSASTAKKGAGPGVVVFLVPAVLLFGAIWAAGRFASRRPD